MNSWFKVFKNTLPSKNTATGVITVQPGSAGWASTSLLSTCALLSVIILLVDLAIPLGVACGVPYIAVVLLSLNSPHRRFTILVAIICSCLTVLGFAISPHGGELWKVVSNRGLALFAVWVTTSLALTQRTRDRELAENQLVAMESAKELEVQEERIKVLRATMRTVHDIVGNFLNHLQLFQLEAEEKGALDPESQKLMTSMIHDTSIRLKRLGDLDTIHEKKMAGGIGIDYEQSDGENPL